MAGGKHDPHNTTSLFNGLDKSGWTEGSNNQGEWKVINGILTGIGGGSPGKAAILDCDRRNLTNFTLRAKILNSDGKGKQIMVRRSFGPGTVSGYGIMVGGSETSDKTDVPVGSIYKRVNGAYNSRIDWAVFARSRPETGIGDWYVIEISARGNRVTTTINDVQVAEYTDLDEPFASGEIGLYCRSNSTISYREVSITSFEDKK